MKKKMWCLLSRKGEVVGFYWDEFDAWVKAFNTKKSLLNTCGCNSEKELEPGEVIKLVEFEV